jgi:hypothetical protein
MTSALALSSDPGRHAQGSRCRDHLSAIRIVPPRHHIERPSPFGRCLSRHAAQRSRSCTSFDAHDPRSLRSHTHSSEDEREERCLRSSAHSDADFRSHPKAMGIFRCARQLPASIFRRRVPLPPAFAAASAPASALAFRPGRPPALMSFDLHFHLSAVARSEDPGCSDRFASLDARDPSALPCSRSRTFSCLPTDRTSSLRPIFRFVLSRWPVLGTHVHARVRFTPLGANEHTHCARSYSAYCHRESLVLSSPNEPPCSSF